MEDILKAGWLEKEYASKSWFKFRPRYVVLTTLNLKYYYQQNEAYDEHADHARQDIPLLTVNDAAVLDHGTREPEVLHIETTSRTWRFKAPNAAEAEQWRQAIFAARNRLGVSRVKFGSMPAKAGVGARPLSAVREDEENDENDEDKGPPKDPLEDMYSTYQANEELINALENVTCSSVDKAKYTANLFFESMVALPSKDRTVRTKEMGRAMVAWVDCEGNERVGSGYDSCLKMDVFMMWIRIALSREFVASCKFDESTAAASADEDASSESSCMTHSTIKSRMKNIRLGTIIMPFRADTAECLFIAAIIHASSLKYNFLRLLLHGGLRPVALNPDNYTYPRSLPQLPSDPHHPLPPHPMHQLQFNPLDKPPAAGSGNMRESLSRQSSRFMGLFRGVFSSRNSSARPGHGSMSMDSDRPMSVDNANRPSSAMLASYLYLINPTSRGGQQQQQTQEAAAAALNELALLSPTDLKRLEVRKRLQDCATALVNRFQEVSADFPVAIVTILKTIRDLIIITLPGSMASSSSSAKADKEDPMEPRESESEQYRNRRRFEYGTYFTSCSALLFLRLICRAIISPDEYGVTKRITTAHATPPASNSSSNRASKRMSRSYAEAAASTTYEVPEPAAPPTKVFPKALAPMLLLAHTVAYEAPEESHKKAAAGPRRELLESRYAAEIMSLSKNLSQQMPADMVSLLLLISCADADADG